MSQRTADDRFDEWIGTPQSEPVAGDVMVHEPSFRFFPRGLAQGGVEIRDHDFVWRAPGSGHCVTSTS